MNRLLFGVEALRWAWQFLWARPATALLNMVMLAVAMASMVLVLLLQTRLSAAFEQDVRGIDAVVGAKGSPLQLILSAVLHVDAPTGNIPLAALRELEKDPRLLSVVPLSLGDSLEGFRIVGTTPAYAQWYSVGLAVGHWWSVPVPGAALKAVVGATVAARTGLTQGAPFAGSHGLSGAGPRHDGVGYEVSGILQPCQCVLDRLVLTSTEAVWTVHDAEQGIQPQDLGEVEREVTAILVRYRSPLAALTFVRQINQDTRFQAASAAVEVSRLLSMLGAGLDVIRGLAGVLLLMAATSMVVAQCNAVRQRAPDLAMLRMLGASRGKIASLLFCESLIVVVLAGFLGLVMGVGLTGLLSYWMQGQSHAWLLATRGTELPLAWGSVLSVAFVLSVLVSVLPVWRASRQDVAQELLRA